MKAMSGEKKPDFLFVNKTADSRYLSKFDREHERTLKQQVYEHVQRSRDLDEERRNRTRPRKKRKPVTRLNQNPPTPQHSAQPGNVAQATATSSISPDIPVRTTSSAISPASSTVSPTKPVTPSRRRVPKHHGGKGTLDDGIRARQRTPPSLTRCIPKDATTDPFNATQVRLTEKNVPIFHYFEIAMFPAVTRQDSPNIVKSLSVDAKQVLDECKREPLHVYALLAGACARMKCVTYNDFQEPKMPDLRDLFLAWANQRNEQLDKKLPRIESVRALSYVYKHRSYELLRIVHDTINNGDPRMVDAGLIQTLYFIWTMESYRRNWDAVTQIRKYLFGLCDRYLGGFAELPSHLQKMLYFADRFHAHATDDKPLIPAPFVISPLSSFQWDTITNAILAAKGHLMGVALMNFSHHFSDEFKQRMEEMRHLACVIQCHWTKVVAESIKSQEEMAMQDTDLPLLPDREWVMKSTYNLSDLLLRERSEDEVSSPIQELIRVALIAWLAFITVPITGIPDTQRKIYDVRVTVRVDSLQKRFLPFVPYTSDSPANIDGHPSTTHALDPGSDVQKLQSLLIWAAGLGVLACGELLSNERKTSSKEEDRNEFKGDDINFFRGQFERLARQMSIRNWEQFQTLHETEGLPWLIKLDSAQNWRLNRILGELWKDDGPPP